MVGLSSKWTGLEVIWLAGANVAGRVTQRPTSLAHAQSLCHNRRSVARIQIGHRGNESAVH